MVEENGSIWSRRNASTGQPFCLDLRHGLMQDCALAAPGTANDQQQPPGPVAQLVEEIPASVAESLVAAAPGRRSPASRPGSRVRHGGWRSPEEPPRPQPQWL